MIRLLLLGLALFLASRVVGGLFKSESTTKVNGESKNEPLELSEDDVIDVDFKEIKDE